MARVRSGKEVDDPAVIIYTMFIDSPEVDEQGAGLVAFQVRLHALEVRKSWPTQR